MLLGEAVTPAYPKSFKEALANNEKYVAVGLNSDGSRVILLSVPVSLALKDRPPPLSQRTSRNA